MFSFGGKISQQYGWEVTVFHKVRQYRDGVSFLEIQINWDRYEADHCPRFRFYLMVLNLTIIEWNIYYLFHRDSETE